jgi:hypothetical protein
MGRLGSYVTPILKMQAKMAPEMSVSFNQLTRLINLSESFAFYYALY